ncbi:DNA polymerase III subunit delta [Gloeocapsa sp. PCC 73106]|uniref:DNA polymerase III subunit delta n=1 Tax=Gloeocapsa sp. PCC 73106 TaxID=102232 RepID=UPI0002AD1205|nr:DNA polymerase III subunit delta [Gloeocapsa sp. PCC 73106]ELR98720.1 DNA polymerase III, delta subunit [Gloeocapsa sp. PCC 73106]
MPIYFFWGDDDFALLQAVEQIKQKAVDPNWLSFNYDKIFGEQDEAIIAGLDQAMSAVFDTGERLIWLVETTVGQQCSQRLLSELERTIPQILATSHLVLSTSKKPDGRLKSTKLLQKYATFREFSLISPWQSAEILQKVKEAAQEKGVKLTAKAQELLATCVGNQTRQLYNELDKLSLYQQSESSPLDTDAIADLVNASTQNSLQLALAIRRGDQSEALNLVTELINRNEAPLKIVATVVGQFRTWTIVKVLLTSGTSDTQLIANLAGINNPKRIYFLRQEISNCSVTQLLATLPILWELELNLKQGYEPLSTLKSKIIELCTVFNSPSPIC